jgi:DNA repair protein RadC
MYFNSLAEEKFSYHDRHFKVSMNRAVNRHLYLRLACTQFSSGEGETQVLRFFEEDIENFIQALASVFHAASYRVDFEKQSGNLFREPEGVKGLKSWEANERPREKLMEQGREAMSDAELLAMLICSGLPGITAVDLAEKVLVLAGGELKQLAALKAEDLMQIRGIGHARALSVISAMELAVRLAAREQPLHFLKLVKA